MERLGKLLHGREGREAEQAGSERIKSRSVTSKLCLRDPSTPLRCAQDDVCSLKNDYGIPRAHEVFHACGVPVGEANTAVAGSAANCLRIIRAVNTDAWLV